MFLCPAGGGPGIKTGCCAQPVADQETNIYAYYADRWAQQPKFGAAIELANQISSFKQESMRSHVLSTKPFLLTNTIIRLLVIGLVTLVDLICH